MLRQFTNKLFQQQTSASAVAAAAAASSSTNRPAGTGAAGGLRKVRVRSNNKAPSLLSDIQKRVSAELTGDCSTTSPVEKKPLTALQKRQLAMKDKLVFGLRPNAVYRIKLLMDGHNRAAEAKGEQKAIGIRVGVQKRGCSGLSYTVNYAMEEDYEKFLKRKAELEKKYNGIIPIDALDSHVEESGVHVFVDAGSLYYVVGTKMDYTVSEVEEKFEFNNPNSKDTCGCGDSWMPDM